MTNLEYIKSKIIKNGELDVEGFVDTIMEDTHTQCCSETTMPDCYNLPCRDCYKAWLDKDKSK